MKSGSALQQWWAPVTGVGCCSGGSIRFHSNAVISTPASAEITRSLPLIPVKVTPESLEQPHLHTSTHPHSPKHLEEVWMVVGSWLPFLRLLCSKVSEHVLCALVCIIPCLNRTTTKKLLNNMGFVRRKPVDLGKRILCLLSIFREVIDRLSNLKNEMSFFPGALIKRPCPAQNLGNVAYFLSLAVEVSPSVIASISRLWHCADLSPRACI